MTIKFLKHGIRYNGKYIPVWYSKGKLLHHPEGTITIYANAYDKPLPPELHPENDTELQSDYFEKDRARILPDSKYYKDIMKLAR